jgi:hypothetical protein
LRQIGDLAIRLGFPDPAGGVLYQGPITISWFYAPPRPETVTYDGVHVKLPNGAWIIHCTLPIAPRDGLTIDASKAMPVDQRILIQGDTAWLHQADAFMHARCHSVEDVPITDGPTYIAASRCGVAKADDFLKSYVIPSTRWDYEPWTPIALGIHDPIEVPRIPFDWSSRVALAERNARLPQPVVAVRRALMLWFRGQLMEIPDPFLALAAAQAAAGAAAMTSPADHDAVAYFDKLASRAGLLGLPPITSRNISARLTVWKVSVPSSAIEAQDFTFEELGGLIALAGDAHPSTWLDGWRPRSVGDQALRAIASVLGIDPRYCAGHGLGAPWTDQEQQDVAGRLSTWWQLNEHRTLAQIQTAMMPSLPPVAIAHLIGRTPPSQRSPLMAVCSELWKSGPPDGPLEPIIAVAKGDSAFAALVDSWPIDESHRLPLSVWHVFRHNQKPATALLDHALEDPQSERGVAALHEALTVNSFMPDAPLLARLQSLIGDDPLSDAGERIVVGCCIDNGREEPLAQLWNRLDSADPYPLPVNMHLETLRLILLAQMLADKRLAPETLIGKAGRMLQAEKLTVASLPHDVRICDLAAFDAADVLNRMLDRPAAKAPHWDMTVSIDARDKAIADLMAVALNPLKRVLLKAHLPLLVPGVPLQPRATNIRDF